MKNFFPILCWFLLYSGAALIAQYPLANAGVWSVKVAKLCLTLCPPLGLHRILQVRIVEWIAFPFSRGSSQTRDWTQVSPIAFELWCWRTLLRVPWTARSSESILKQISPGCSLEGLILKLKLQYFGHPMQRTDSLEKTLMLGKIWGQEEKGMTEDEMVGWHHRLNGHGFGWTLGVGDGQGGLACCSSWGRRVRHDWATELKWTPPSQAGSLPAEPQGKHKNTGVGSLPLLQVIFLTQESNQGLLHCRWIL